MNILCMCMYVCIHVSSMHDMHCKPRLISRSSLENEVDGVVVFIDLGCNMHACMFSFFVQSCMPTYISQNTQPVRKMLGDGTPLDESSWAASGAS